MATKCASATNSNKPKKYFKTCFTRKSEQVETLSYKRRAIIGEDVELTEELKHKAIRWRGRQGPKVKHYQGSKGGEGPLSFRKFLDAPIKAFGRRKFFKGTSKIRLEVVRKFYASDHTQAEYYAIMDGKSIYFNVKAINNCTTCPLMLRHQSRH
ncbi:hypothetical protein E5676_scaffold279G00020 [Cucumis melo var. makuwa]|uniref:Uncharacterized protein n=1 Tax=Cucumis melo var. makuwa TaxID=1194695 RepID=A0A5D3DV25_CUCMM|nr:hypothetical protein E6C27_scaffold280G001190 [Cucumis melo var. makuwa]TYK27637.1 hypothetical protein E5676_scaffold279G00020 [Cucumis melo var. makuwa]